MKANLQSRLTTLAQTRLHNQQPLTQADVETLQKETGATAAEIRAGFAKALKAGIAAVEGAGDSSQQLRQASQGGLFAGQQRGSAATSPMLQGANLKTPAELIAPFAQMGQQMLALAQGYSAGQFSEADVKSALEAMPQQSNQAKEALWGPTGADARDAFNQGQAALAAVLPNLQVENFGGYTLEESRLLTELNSTFDDPSAQKQAAQELLDKYPDSRIAPWAQSIMQKHAHVSAASQPRS